MKPKFNPDKIKLIIGLGNAKKEFWNTYHNIGSQFVEFLKNTNMQLEAKILRNESYMNESGMWLKKTADYLKCSSEKILVAHDDSDIPIGDYKISFASRSAGHGGVASIIQNLKTDQFWRLRIGIRDLEKDKEKRRKALEFVLNKITKKDSTIFKKVFVEILDKFFI